MNSKILTVNSLYRAALKLNGQIKKCNFDNVNKILNSVNYPIDEPLTDTKMNALAFTCCKPIESDNDGSNNLSMIKIILAKEPNLNFQDRYGRTALHHACMAANADAVRLLLEVKGNSHGPLNIDV